MEMLRRFFWLLVACLLLTAVHVRAEDDDDDTDDAGEGDSGTDVREERDVVVLTEDNFDSYTESNPMVLIEFYAPWCGHCKSLAPEYEKAAKALKSAKYPVPLAKVDATVNNELAGKYGVDGYPTLKFWKDGTMIEYDGPREADGIVQWVSEKADPDYKPPPEEVVTVTKDNFDDFINSEDLVLLEFYAPWCGHCKQLAPKYEAAAKILKMTDPRVPLGKVDATKETELASKYGVSGYPSLKMFRKGKDYEYKGPRDTNGIVDYMIKNSGEAAKLLPTMRDVRGAVDKEAATVLGFFDNLEDAQLRAFMNIANERREDLSFGYTLLPEARDMYKTNPGDIIVITPEKFQTKHEPKYHVLKTAGKSEGDIGEFIAEKQVPLVAEYSEKTDKFYEPYSKKIFCITFYTVDWSFDHKAATQLWRNKVADIAKDYKGEIKFAIANEERYMSSLMKDMGLDESGEEFNIGCFMDSKKYRMEPMDEFDEDEIRGFLKKLKSGKLKPQIKSQPVPKKSKGPVKVVVGSTFEKIVGDKSKDVLIEFYAPWCGHCKTLEPVYKELAKSVKNEKNLIIAKLDATANDIPDEYQVQGFPTIYFAPANSKKSPLKFEGDRTVEGFTKYLQEKATVSFGKNYRDEL